MIQLDPSFDDHITSKIICYLQDGETVKICDSFSYIFSHEASPLNDPRFLFLILDPVFERLPAKYVLDHLKFSIDNYAAVYFCMQFWIRTEMGKWWNNEKY